MLKSSWSEPDGLLSVSSPQSVSVRADGSLRQPSWLCPRDSDRLQGQQPEPGWETLHTAQLVPRVSTTSPPI